MSSESDDLRAAILADLDADAPRLVYADALQAAGDPRGELIAIQCELARFGLDRTRLAQWGCPEQLRKTISFVVRRDWLGDGLSSAARDDVAKIAKLRKREEALLEAHPEWAGNLVSHRFRRGFVEHVNAGGRYTGERIPVGRLFNQAPAATSLAVEVRDDAADLFAEPRIRQLRQLRISLSSVDDSRVFIERVSELTALRELALAGLDRQRPNWKSVGGDPGAAIDALARLPWFSRIEALDLYDQKIDPPTQIAQLFAAPLRHLRVGMACSGGDVLRAIASEHRAASLEILDLAYAVRGGLPELASSRHLQQLHALRCYEPYATDEFMVAAPAIGNGFPALRVLDLAYAPICPVAKSLFVGSGLGRLERLTIDSCGLDDAAVRVLASSPLFGRLRAIDLRDNKITDSGAAALAAGTTDRLELLDLRGNRISAPARDTLKRALPATRVLAGKRS